MDGFFIMLGLFYLGEVYLRVHKPEDEHTFLFFKNKKKSESDRLRDDVFQPFLWIVVVLLAITLLFVLAIK